MPPTLANGKICYIELPAVDVQASADFYARVFGWRVRKRGKVIGHPHDLPARPCSSAITA